MPRIKSGTDEARAIITGKANFQFGGKSGLDLGYGGDSISPYAINVDLPLPYTKVGEDPQHLAGDARHLTWFKDDCLDYVYSSHLLEDFPNTTEILKEWIRVIKPGGMLILVLPNEMRYRAHCQKFNEGRNMHHTIEEMSVDYMLPIIKELGLEPYFVDWCGYYSFIIMAIKPE